MANNLERTHVIDAVEREAEHLVALQLDLIAELERQLRAVHHAMRSIEKLRGKHDRIGPELTNGERLHTLSDLDQELVGIDEQMAVQGECCHEMHRIIGQMQDKLARLRHSTAKPILSDAADSPQKPADDRA